MTWLDDINVEVINRIEMKPEGFLCWRFPRFRNEISTGAQLVVTEDRAAVVVYQGEVFDVFGPGEYVLNASSLPKLANHLGWAPDYSGSFVADFYFVTTAPKFSVSWQTANPASIQDDRFGAIPVMANGSLNIRCLNPELLVAGEVACEPELLPAMIPAVTPQIIASGFADFVSGNYFGADDLKTSQDVIIKRFTDFIAERLANKYGIAIENFVMTLAIPQEIATAIANWAPAPVVDDPVTEAESPVTEAPVTESPVTETPEVDAPVADPVSPDVVAPIATDPGVVSPIATAPDVAAPIAEPASTPTAPDPEPMYHVGMPGGSPMGPYPLSQLQRDAAAGRFGPQMLVWTPGMPNWLPVGHVPAIAKYFPNHSGAGF